MFENVGKKQKRTKNKQLQKYYNNIQTSTKNYIETTKNNNNLQKTKNNYTNPREHCEI